MRTQGGLYVHFGVGVGFSPNVAYDFGERDCWISDDSCRKILAGREVGAEEGISGPDDMTASPRMIDLYVSTTPATRQRRKQDEQRLYVELGGSVSYQSKNEIAERNVADADAVSDSISPSISTALTGSNFHHLMKCLPPSLPREKLLSQGQAWFTRLRHDDVSVWLNLAGCWDVARGLFSEWLSHPMCRPIARRSQARGRFASSNNHR